jgi:hypothetical protein
VPLGLLLIALSSSAPPSARVSHDFYGMNLAAIPSQDDAARMAGGGTKMARYPFDWRVLQPVEGGAYEFASTDELVAHLATARITTLPILYGSASWLKHNYRRPPINTKRGRSGWRQLITAAVHRYGPGGDFWTLHPSLPYEPIRFWQVWNEPNLPGFFAPRASPSRYARLLHISAAAIRRADPTLKVVLAGLPHTALRKGQMVSWRFLRGLYKHGAKGDFDVLAVHPFALDVKGVVDQLKRLRQVTRRYGQGGLPMWIDEVGWPSGHDSKNPLAVGRHEQAALLRHTFHYVLKHRDSLGIKRLFWVLWRDRPQAPGCIFCPAGLINRHGHGKPAWTSYKRFATR